MKILFLLPLFFSLVDTAEIKWNDSTPLQWDDFSGEIDQSSEYDAWTWSGFNFTYTWKTVDGAVKVDCTAYSFFDPSKSWVKKNKKSDELLAHERVHFNISELYSRYFKERVKLFTFSNEVSIEMDSIYVITFEELLATQIEYDKETEHYKNKVEQIRWEKFVNTELERLEEYK